MTDQKMRVREILTAEHADLFPTLARLLAFETTHDVKMCAELFALAKISRDEHIAKHPELARQEADRLAKASWATAVASANERFH